MAYRHMLGETIRVDTAEMDRSTPCALTRVLLVSPLPPPVGGMQTWTETLLRRGLPRPFDVDLVDTRVSRPHHAMSPRLTYREVKRFLRILWRIYLSLRSVNTQSCT